jgi:hypothetical protein
MDYVCEELQGLLNGVLEENSTFGVIEGEEDVWWSLWLMRMLRRG